MWIEFRGRIFCLFAGAVFVNGSASSAQQTTSARPATGSGVRQQSTATSSTAVNSGTQSALQPCTNNLSPPSPTSVRYLNYAQYDPWAFVPKAEQRNLTLPSPGYGRNGLSVNAQTSAPTASTSPSSKTAPAAVPITIQYHGPNPSEMRQHYAHYIPGAFSHSQNDVTKGNENANPIITPPPQVLKYTDQYPSPLPSNGSTEAGSYQSQLNF